MNDWNYAKSKNGSTCDDWARSLTEHSKDQTAKDHSPSTPRARPPRAMSIASPLSLSSVYRSASIPIPAQPAYPYPYQHSNDIHTHTYTARTRVLKYNMK